MAQQLRGMRPLLPTRRWFARLRTTSRQPASRQPAGCSAPRATPSSQAETAARPRSPCSRRTARPLPGRDGRPSCRPSGSMAAESYAFFATALGPRLVLHQPAGANADRAGTVVAERSVVSADRQTTSGSLRAGHQRAGDSSRRGWRQSDPASRRRRPMRRTAEVVSDRRSEWSSADHRHRIRGRSARDAGSLASGDMVRLAPGFAARLCSSWVPSSTGETCRAGRQTSSARPRSAAAVVVIARVLARMASPADWSEIAVFSSSEYAGTLLPPLLTSPFDFLLTALAAGALAGLLMLAVDAWRVARLEGPAFLSRAVGRVWPTSQCNCWRAADSRRPCPAIRNCFATRSRTRRWICCIFR